MSILDKSRFKAPKGQFRLIFVDTFGDDWIGDDFETLDLAREEARERTKNVQKLKAHIYDDQGHHVGEYESF